jgi:DNA recombination protein RmuC
MEALEPAFAEVRRQLSELGGKVEQVRVSAEARQGPENQAWQGIQQVRTALATLTQLPESQQALHAQVASAVRDLEAIKGRWSREDQAYTSLQRLSAVMLGSATAGAAGERVVEEALSTLPPQWRVTDHRVGGKPVEFAVRLPDGLLLPIDSKVVAQSELDALDHAPEPERRKTLENQLRAKVLAKAREVTKYLDGRSAGFAIAAVPDAAYQLCGAVLPQAYQEHRVLIVPYSMLAPFVLLVYEQHRHSEMDLDAARAQRLLDDAQAHTRAALEELNGRVATSLTTLKNGSQELNDHLSQAVTALSRLRGAADGAPAR